MACIEPWIADKQNEKRKATKDKRDLACISSARHGVGRSGEKGHGAYTTYARPMIGAYYVKAHEVIWRAQVARDVGNGVRYSC